MFSIEKCRLATGRTHQIRVHMTERGHPLIGDRSYGDAASAGRLRRLPPAVRLAAAAFPRQALHAILIGFRHPVSGEYVQFTSPLPRDIADLVGSLDRL